MLAELDVEVAQTSQLANTANTKDERGYAKGKILELRNTLQLLKNNVMQQAQQAKLRGELDQHGPSWSDSTTKRITNWVHTIAEKVPVVNQLERKIGML
jgi:hypothetical protein